MAHRLGLARAAVAIAIVVSAFHFASSAWRAQASGIVDFPIFAEHVAEFSRTGVLYPDADDPATYEPAAAVYKFPPLYALLLQPFVNGGVDPRLYFQHWVFQLILYVVAVAVLGWALRPRGRTGAFVSLVLLVTLNHEPFFENLWKQQAEAAILLLLALSIVCIRRELHGAAGALLGIAVMLKVYPAALAVYFLVRRRYAALAWCTGAMILVTISTTIVFGLRENAVYFLQILPRMLGEFPVATSENLSLGRYAQALGGLGPLAAKHVVRLIGLALLATTVLAVLRAPRRGHEALAFSAFIPPLLLVIPNSWVSYQLLLVIPLVVLLAVVTEEQEAGRGLAAIVFASAALMLFYWPCAAPDVPWPCARTPFFLGLVQLPRGLHDLLVDGRVLATFLTWVAVLLALHRPAAPETTIAVPRRASASVSPA